MDNERDRTIAVLRAMDRAQQELEQGPTDTRTDNLMLHVQLEIHGILDCWNNGGHPDCVPIRDEEWKQS